VTDPQPGDLWRYDYLWRWQADRGENEGRKPRPVAFVASIRTDDGKTHLFILPLTTSSPGTDRLFIAVPEIECRRAGLPDAVPVWLMLDEYNYDVLPTSVTFEPDGRIGRFGPAFHRKVLQAFQSALRNVAARRVRR
jgi:hypothetical protein